MARQIRRVGRWLLLLAPLLLLVVLAARPAPVLALGPGSNATPLPECWCEYECPSCSSGASVWTAAGVNVLTRELRHLQPFPGCYGPTKLGTLRLGVLHRSYLDTTGQFGNGLIPSWETTVSKVITSSGSPESAYGHHVDVLYPTGLPVTFDWDGSAYVCSTCGVTDALSRPGGSTGTYLLVILAEFPAAERAGIGGETTSPWTWVNVRRDGHGVEGVRRSGIGL